MADDDRIALTYPPGAELGITIDDDRERRRFKWPCFKRRAHEPHHVDVQVPYDCPGVKAHPATQIGGSYDEW